MNSETHTLPPKPVDLVTGLPAPKKVDTRANPFPPTQPSKYKAMAEDIIRQTWQGVASDGKGHVWLRYEVPTYSQEDQGWDASLRRLLKPLGYCLCTRRVPEQGCIAIYYRAHKPTEVKK